MRAGRVESDIVAVFVEDVFRFRRKRRREGGREDLGTVVDAGELVAEDVLLLSADDEAVVKDVDEVLRCEVRWSTSGRSSWFRPRRLLPSSSLVLILALGDAAAPAGYLVSIIHGIVFGL